MIRKFLRKIKAGNTSNLKILQDLEVFYPLTSSPERFVDLALSAANSFPTQLSQLIPDQSSKSALPLPPAPSGIITSFEEAFKEFGSDKSTKHNYHETYASILHSAGTEAPLNVLEIGLGTNDASAVSTMGTAGRPGASLRAFRKLLPNANIYGLDIDQRILFSDDRIKTSHVDQTDPSTFPEALRRLGCNTFDLIIDDGLHSVEANMNTLLHLKPYLNDGGWMVIEDIPSRTAAVWLLVERLLTERNIACRLLDTPTHSLFLTR